jgi:hypothetical protein
MRGITYWPLLIKVETVVAGRPNHAQASAKHR